MPRYYLDIGDAVLDRDEDGVDLPNDEEARAAAVQLAGALLADRPQELTATGRFRVLLRREKMAVSVVEVVERRWLPEP